MSGTLLKQVHLDFPKCMNTKKISAGHSGFRVLRPISVRVFQATFVGSSEVLGSLRLFDLWTHFRLTCNS
jgi:hypothetical protein